MNKYTDAFKNISSLQECNEEHFAEQALENAEIVFNKGAKIYKLMGTKFIIMTHSDEFKTTPNEVSWYQVVDTNEELKISLINVVDRETIELGVSVDMYEEIMFFVQACVKC